MSSWSGGGPLLAGSTCGAADGEGELKGAEKPTVPDPPPAALPSPEETTSLQVRTAEDPGAATRRAGPALPAAPWVAARSGGGGRRGGDGSGELRGCLQSLEICSVPPQRTQSVSLVHAAEMWPSWPQL
jgi:hypothetical protein